MENKRSAIFELGDCLQKAADCILTGVQSTSEHQLREAEGHAATQASSMLQEAATLYNQVCNQIPQDLVQGLFTQGKNRPR